ncbi:MAG: ABC-F type ribosomal protection protein [Lachnospiraceae bacterium]|nr:ABC-F type ribosomal protection protein [Lachnospiraceae bacterium]
MFEVTLYGVKKYMDATLVLEDVTFEAYAGEKVGIVGDNGSGKSTILKLIAGVLPMHYYPGYPEATSYGYDEGFVSVPKDAVCAYLEQMPEYEDSYLVIDVLRTAFKEVYELEVKMREFEEQMTKLCGEELEKALKQYSALTAKYETLDGYRTEEKLSRICTGLKLTESFLKRKFSLLSGGEKTRVLLGRLLMDQPDVLLLDEPTNHLDMDSIRWLEDYLKNYSGIVMVVSHDRYFLDHVVGKIVEIEDKKAISYRGNYSSYVRQKEENLRIEYEHYLEQQKKINSMEKTIKELRDWAIRADNKKFFRRAASMQNKLDRMERMKRPVLEQANMKMDLKSSDRSGNDTIIVENLCKQFDEKMIFKDASLLIKYRERVALIGPNGCGKTTFIKMLLGEETPLSGEVRMGANVKMAYLPQNFKFQNEELTVLECFREDIIIQDGKAREYLSKYLFFGNSVFTKVKQLSGGERIRLMLAKMLYEEINLLILDEPTNHLDISSIEALEETLEDFTGTVFFISHDRYLINKIAKRVVEIENGSFKSYAGNYDEYRAEKEKFKSYDMQQDTISNKNMKTDKSMKLDTDMALDKKARKVKTVNEERKREAKQATLEEKITLLEAEIEKVDAAMLAEDVGYMELSDLYGRKEALKMQLELLMEQWMEMAE